MYNWGTGVCQVQSASHVCRGPDKTPCICDELRKTVNNGMIFLWFSLHHVTYFHYYESYYKEMSFWSMLCSRYLNSLRDHPFLCGNCELNKSLIANNIKNFAINFIPIVVVQFQAIFRTWCDCAVLGRRTWFLAAMCQPLLRPRP